MRRMIFLLFAALTLAFAATSTAIIDYKQLPTCAKSCIILSTSELICVPPAAPVSNNATYVNCFCQSDYLKALHANGELCHQFCPQEDNIAIHHYYNKLCGTPDPAFSSSTTSLPAPTPTSSLEAVETSAAAPAPPKDGEEKPRDHGAWLQDNWKYLVIAGVLLLFTLVILFGLAFLHRNHRKKQDLERANRHNGMIPLQLMLAAATSRPTTSGEEDLDNLPTPAVSSPLGSPGSPHSFSDSLRMYAEEVREREERRVERGGPPPVFGSVQRR